MGVLSHKRSPLDHLLELRQALRPGGELMLETLVVEGDEQTVLVPQDRYAATRNVFFLPSTALLSDASRKGARFVRMCDGYGLPVVTLVDCPGYMPDRRAEADGITVHGAKLLHAYAAADVPLLTVVTREAYGGAYIMVGSRAIGAGVVWAWPGAEIGVMGARPSGHRPGASLLAR